MPETCAVPTALTANGEHLCGEPVVAHGRCARHQPDPQPDTETPDTLGG